MICNFFHFSLSHSSLTLSLFSSSFHSLARSAVCQPSSLLLFSLSSFFSLSLPFPVSLSSYPLKNSAQGLLR